MAQLITHRKVITGKQVYRILLEEQPNRLHLPARQKQVPAIFRWIVRARGGTELIGRVLDCWVLLVAHESQKNQGIRKVNYIPSEYRKCDRLIERAV